MEKYNNYSKYSQKKEESVADKLNNMAEQENKEDAPVLMMAKSDFDNAQNLRAYINEDGSDRIPFAPKELKVVNCNNLNVRALPGSKDILEVLSKGDLVHFTGKYEILNEVTWYQIVTILGSEGYSMKDFLMEV